ncbi:hypothetical protein EAV90_23025 [Bradyrhizobium vignae]|nr:hypothetical protein EAV90_23025 [Bradyrhizobium vignae]
MLGYSDDERDYSDAAKMLSVLGISPIRLMSDNPEKAMALTAAGVQVAELVSCRGTSTPFNRAYLKARAARTPRSLVASVSCRAGDGSNADRGEHVTGREARVLACRRQDQPNGLNSYPATKTRQ